MIASLARSSGEGMMGDTELIGLTCDVDAQYAVLFGQVITISPLHQSGIFRVTAFFLNTSGCSSQ
jgi:hypothetical protein